MTPLAAPDAHTRAWPRGGRVGGPYDFMPRVLATDTGGKRYSRRQCMAEPVFADINTNRRPQSGILVSPVPRADPSGMEQPAVHGSRRLMKEPI